MQLYTIDPLSDARWDDLVASHPRASVFHHRGWLKALASTYGYRPMVLTSTPTGGPLRDGIVFCEVKSWITGSRLVSLPFADHCEPLEGDFVRLFELAEWMRTERKRRRWKYIELRPLSLDANSDWPFLADQHFWLHTLDLVPPLEQIFSGLHKNSIQRRIRRAEREQLSYQIGCSEQLMNDFYGMLVITKKRHHLLPQPRVWFRNLIAGMGQNLQIRVARKNDVPIAAMLTLRHRNTVVYKYGCSDERFHHVAAMPFLFWKLIEESKAAGGEQIDLGRTDMNNDGLIAFKDRFGATRRKLTYYQYPGNAKRVVAPSNLRAAKHLFSALPNALLPWAGRLVYRHIG
jgi:hypothetical protein